MSVDRQKLTPGDLFRVATIAARLGATKIALRRQTFESLMRGRRSAPPADDRTGAERASVDHLAWLVAGTSRRVPWPVTCLERSMVLDALLRKRGIRSSLCVGVQRTSRGALDAHAWVEVNGHVSNDAEDVRTRYDALPLPGEPR